MCTHTHVRVHTHVHTHANTALKAAGIVSELETHPACDPDLPAPQEAALRTPSGRWLNKPEEISPQTCGTADTVCVSFSIITENQQAHPPNPGNNSSLNHQVTWLRNKHMTCEINGPSICLWVKEQVLTDLPSQGHGGIPSAPL